MFIMQFDACDRKNLGLSSIGYVLYYDTLLLAKHYSLINYEVADSNCAEYIALIEAIKFAKSLNINNLHIEGDAKIVIEQINNRCNVKSNSVKPFLKEVNELKKSFNNIEFQHIYRKYNIMADSLATQALYQELIN